MNTVKFRVVMGFLLPAVLCLSTLGLYASESDIRETYSELVSADHWRRMKAASEKLGEYGEDGLPYLLEGTRHEDRKVRQYCYDVLRSQFGENPEVIQVIIGGLEDENSMISYPSAFYLGQHHITKAKDALRRCMQDTEKDSKTRYGAAKSLAELGEKDVMVMLNTGIGSDDHYTRYLSNIGIKALSGKDLTDFGYEGPWEGAFVSGPGVYITLGQPIEKAEHKLGRWQAIVKYLKWLKQEKPELFKELEPNV